MGPQWGGDGVVNNIVDSEFIFSHWSIHGPHKGCKVLCRFLLI